jgi:hypothetical protein
MMLLRYEFDASRRRGRWFMRRCVCYDQQFKGEAVRPLGYYTSVIPKDTDAEGIEERRGRL